MSNSFPIILLGLAAILMAACGSLNIPVAKTAATIYFTKPDELPPADLSKQIPPHESWCYRTLGVPECYTKPIEGWEDRLINVDPQNRFPLTVRDYNESVQIAH